MGSASSTRDHRIDPNIESISRLLHKVNISLTITHLGAIFVIISFHSPRRSSHRQAVLILVVVLIEPTHFLADFENALLANYFLGVHQPIFGSVIGQVYAFVVAIFHNLLPLLVEIQRSCLIQHLLLAIEIIILFLRNIAGPRNIHPVSQVVFGS